MEKGQDPLVADGGLLEQELEASTAEPCEGSCEGSCQGTGFR